jgi:hypothetical protein
MTTTPDRIVELLPRLPEATRKTILNIAETISRREADLVLTPDEENFIEQGKADFAHGRTLSSDQFEARSADFLKRFHDKAASRS